MSASSRRWSRAHAERLLWRAGFGARPKEIEFWAQRSRERTIDWLIRGGAGPHGTRRMVGPGAARQRQAAGPGQRVGSRHAVVAGQDGPQPAPAAGEAHAVLARPLRHARPGRAAHAGPEPQAAQPRAGDLPRAAAGGDDRSGDAGLPLAGRLRQARPQRELRARADGAVHARRHRRLHRARRARGGPRADGLQGPLARRPRRSPSPTTPSATTTAPSSCSATAASSTGRTSCASSSAIARTRPSSSASCGTSSSPSRCRRRPAGAWRGSTCARTIASRPWCARSSTAVRCTRTSTTRRWSSGRSCRWRATCAWSGARSTPTTGPGSAR